MSNKKIVLFMALILCIASFPALSQTCSPVDTTFVADFTYDGAGDFCWQSSCLGDYINCWNLTTLTINGQNFTNQYVSSNNFPSPVNGMYYIVYSGAYPWSHFEARGTCSTVTVPPTPPPTIAPTVPQITDPPGVGDVSMSPASVTGPLGQNVSFNITVNSGSQVVAAYGLNITYNQNIIGNPQVQEGADGFVSATNTETPGVIITSGFDTSGAGPGTNLDLLVITFSADQLGTSQIGITVNELVDDDTDTIGTPRGIGGSVTIIDDGTPTPTPPPGVGNVSMFPDSVTANEGESVSFSIMVNSGTEKVAAYGLTITYNENVLGNPQVDEGADGFVSATNTQTPGEIITSGFDTSGEGPGSNLELLIISFSADTVGTSPIGISVDDLVDADGDTIGNPTGIGGTVIVIDDETPTPTPPPGVGNVSMFPDSVTANEGGSVSFNLMVNSGTEKVAAYGITITYNNNVLGNPQVDDGADGFVSATNTQTPGEIITSGFDTSGTGPGTNLEFLIISFSADNAGTSPIGIIVDDLVNADGDIIGNPTGIGGTVIVIDDETPTPTPPPGVGNVSMFPDSVTANEGGSVSFNLMVNSGTEKVAAYGITITYNNNVLGNPQVDDGADGFVSATNTQTPGEIITSGFDTSGTGPGTNLEFLIISFSADNAGTSPIGIIVDDLVNADGDTIGDPTGIGGTVTVIPGTGELPWTEEFNNEPGGRFAINAETRTWSSPAIDISSASSVTITAEIEGDNAQVMESSDYLNLYYSIDGGSAVAWSQDTDGFTLKTVTVTGLSGNTLVVSIEGQTSYSDETYYVDNISVTAGETPSPTPTIVPTTPPPTDPPISDLPWTETFDSESGGRFSINSETRTWSSETINISGESSVTITAEIEGDNAQVMESSDYLNLYYSIDGGSAVAWSQDTDGFTLKTVTVTGLSGNTLVVSIEGQTSYSDETYYVDNISVTAGTITAPPTIGPTEPPTPTPTTPIVTEPPTPTPTTTPIITAPPPTIEPTEEPVIISAGSVWIEPASLTVGIYQSFQLDVYGHTGDTKLAAYGINFYFNSSVIEGDPNADDIVEEGADGFIAAVNDSIPGQLITSGFDISGAGPGSALHLLILNMRGVGNGTTSVNVEVDSFADSSGNEIGTLNGIPGSVSVN